MTPKRMSNSTISAQSASANPILQNGSSRWQLGTPRVGPQAVDLVHPQAGDVIGNSKADSFVRNDHFIFALLPSFENCSSSKYTM